MRVWWSLLVFAVGCAPTVRFDMMRAADVTVPSHLRTVAVVDRSRASNVGQAILGALEGAATGESIGADRRGRDQALFGLTETLRSSPRFEVLRPAPEDVDTSLFDRELSWDTAHAICRQAGCDAILGLEAFDSDVRDAFDTRQVEETLESGVKVHRTEHTVERTTRVVTAWRLYDVGRETVVDDLRDHGQSRSWRQSADTRDAALARLPSNQDVVGAVAFDSGVGYARRIAPTPITVARAWYGRGDDALTEARLLAKAGDWDAAARVWESLVEHADAKIRGRAAFDLAVHHERAGRLERALEWAQRAAVYLANSRSRQYVVTLQTRVRDRDRVQEQLAPPPESEDFSAPKVRPTATP
jgi:hypothetical protein